jgi:UDP-N-acetyl-D-mannosaminuronic acid dehydrogenase
MSFGQISIIGLGYIGLPTAAMFASHGVRVVGVDISQSTVDIINRGEIHIVEPGLEEVVQNAVRARMLRAVTTPEPAEAFLIAVPTPFKGDNHEPDLSYIESASQMIAPVLMPGNIVILESTSPVGATDQMARWLAGARPDLSFPHQAGEASDIRIAHCPERVLPGKVMEELISNDRVIGGATVRCAERASALYQTFVKGECVIASSPGVAEMAKLTENSFRDVNIAFANELSLICDKMGLDVWELIRLANRHPRVNILQPGPGVGGHCIAVDPWFIVASAPEQARLIRVAREVNDAKPDWVIEKVEEAIAVWRNSANGATASGPKIICYGLAFKPDIDDLRESPAAVIAEKLARRYPGQVMAVEPNVKILPERLSTIRLVEQTKAQTIGDIHILLVDHQQFRGAPPSHGVTIDAKGIWP